jgi:hypothetical protein
MKKSLWSVLASLLVAYAVDCNAQISNGDFSAGANAWDWRQGVASGLDAPACFGAMLHFTPSLVFDIYEAYSTGGRGRSAKVSGSSTNASIGSTYCRQISQHVYIPPGSVLKFDSKVGTGNKPGPFSPVRGVNFSVMANDDLSGHEFPLFKVSGADFYCGLGQVCSNFAAETVDVSPVWGRTVSLKFKADSPYVLVGGATVGETKVLIDNVRIEQQVVSPSPFKSGSWYNPNRSGHGIHVSRAGNGNFVLIWYTYLADGRPVWYISDTKPAVNGVWQGTLYKSSWNSSTGTNSLLPAGDVKIEMTGQKAMTFYWDLYSINGNNAGFDGAEPFVFLSGGGSYTGLWYEPSYSGWGLSLEYLDNPGGIDTVATAFYYAGSEPVWAQGAVEGTPTGNKIVQLTEYTGIGLCPECVGQETRMFSWPAGMLSLDLDAQRGWIEAQSHSGFPWNRGSSSQPAEIVRMTGP